MASISDRKGVDRRRARGALLGIRTGNQMLHPAWQFDHRRQDTHPGLPLVLAALSEVAADGLDADAIATTPRADADPPGRWDWSGFDHPRHRFDPPSGRFRVRYAANDPVAAARERFPARRITSAASDLHLVRLDSPPAALHLTHQSNLDAVYDWWAATPPPTVYRTRSVPAVRSIAFT